MADSTGDRIIDERKRVVAEFQSTHPEVSIRHGAAVHPGPKLIPEINIKITGGDPDKVAALAHVLAQTVYSTPLT